MGSRAASVRRAVLDLLLRPVVAAAAVALIIVLPLLVVGEISDNEARARSRSEMFGLGSSLAERTIGEIEQYLNQTKQAMNTIAVGDLRAALRSRDADAMVLAAGRAAGVVGGLRSMPTVARVTVTDERGRLLLDMGADDILRCTSGSAFRTVTGGGAEGLACGARSFLARTEGVVDPNASGLLAGTVPPVTKLSDPFVIDVAGKRQSVVAVGSVVTPSDGSATVIGLVFVEIQIEDALLSTARGSADRSEDIYVIDRTGRYVLGARERPVEPLADLMGSALVSKAIRSQPILPTSAPVTLREDAADPFTGVLRPFASAVIRNVARGISANATATGRASEHPAAPVQDRYGWQVLVVPDQTPIRNVEATLTQLRLARVALGVVLVLGAFLLATALQAVSRQRSDLSEALKRQTATAEVLSVISHTTSDLHAVFGAVVEKAWMLCHSDHAWVWREIDGRIRVEAYRGDRPDQVREGGGTSLARLRTATSIMSRAYRECIPVHVPDLAADPDAAGPLLRALGARTALSVPLVHADHVVGVITLARLSVHPFDAADIALAQSFAAQAVIAIENARLIEEVRERSEQLERANLELSAASRHKSEFLANMSHELRTPLNAVIGFSDVLEQGMVGPLSAKQSEYVRDISSSGRHLLDLVNEILDLSKVEAGRMELEPSEFALADTIHGALAFVRERAARHAIELAAEVPADLGSLVADERKVRQVLLNLLSNAVKFTPDGGWIGVTARRADGEVTVSVRDTGIGIAPEDQATVFEEFRQAAKASDRSREGTGLGLTLAKRFVELHGGRIWLESEVGKGTTFTFALPLAVATPTRVTA